MHTSLNFNVIFQAPADGTVSVYEARSSLGFHPQDLDIEDRMNAEWQNLLKKAQEQVTAGKRKSLPFSGPLYRLESWRPLDGGLTLELTVSATTFFQSVGTNWAAGMDAAFMKLLIDRGAARGLGTWGYFADALAICVVVKTHLAHADFPVYIVGVRSGEQDEYPRRIHTFGTLGSRKLFYGRVFDPQESALVECLYKELGLDRSDVSRVDLLGLVENANTLKPELAFLAEVTVPFEGIVERRWKGSQQRAEHTRLFPVTREELGRLLAGAQDLADTSFLNALRLDVEVDWIRKQLTAEPVVNTTNWFVPPGEAAFSLALAREETA